MRYIFSILAICVAFTHVRVSAQTQTLTAGQTEHRCLSLDECLAEAVRQSLILKEGTVNIEQSVANQGTAWNIDRTDISLSQDPLSGGSTDNSITVSQQFAFPTVYVARMKSLQSETRLAERQYASLEKDVVARISSAYYDLSCVAACLSVIERQDSVYSLFVKLAETKYRNGDTNRLEVINAQQTYNENRMLLNEERHNMQSLQLRLRDLMGVDYLVQPMPADEHSLRSMLTDVSDNETLRESSFDFSSTAQGQEMEQRMDVARRQYRLARTEFAPDLSVAFRTQTVLRGFNPYGEKRLAYEKGNFMGFEVGVSVPLFFGEQRSKARASRLQMEKSELLYRQSEREAASLLADAQAECQRTRESALYYENEGHDAATEMARVSQLSYEHGEIGYIEYIQNQKAALDMHLSHLRSLNAYRQAVVRLNSLF